MNIGQKVRELRIAKNLTQEELADRSELSKGFIFHAGTGSYFSFYRHTG